MKRQSRLCKMADAASQLAQVTLLRRHQDSDSDESTSGRCYWEAHHGRHAGHWSWVWAERAINAVFFFDHHNGKGHCELADLRDYYRAKEKVRRYETRQGVATKDSKG